tara:strand:+ start:8502 stop:9866 length:1365 start_codon:yes stop_codon:yes gene_type:complete
MFIYLTSFLLLLIYLVVDFDISIPFFVFFWLIIGNLIIYSSFSKENFINSQRIFYVTFFTYLGFMLLTKIFYIDNPFSDYFYVPDPISFYERIFIFSQSNVYTGANLLDFNNLNVINHGTGLYYLGWAIGRISYAIGGINSPVIHNIVVVWGMAMINVFLYNISRYFLDKQKSEVIAIAYGIFSYSLIFSSVLLRDQHVAFLIAIGFYIILGSFSVKKIILLLALAVITFIFRPTHGVYYLLLIVFYLYIPLKKYKALIVLFSVIVLFLFIRFAKGSEFGENLVDRSQTYTEFHEEKATKAGGAAKLYGALPSFLHPPTRIFQSQINPFSLLRVTVVKKKLTNTMQYQYLSYAVSIGDFLWFVIWVIILYGLRKKYLRKSIPNSLFFAFLLAMTLLVLGGFSSFDNRRLLGVYPIIYLTAMIILFNLTKVRRKIIVNIAVVVFISMGILLNILF